MKPSAERLAKRAQGLKERLMKNPNLKMRPLGNPERWDESDLTESWAERKIRKAMLRHANHHNG